MGLIGIRTSSVSHIWMCCGRQFCCVNKFFATFVQKWIQNPSKNHWKSAKQTYISCWCMYFASRSTFHMSKKTFQIKYSALIVVKRCTHMHTNTAKLLYFIHTFCSTIPEKRENCSRWMRKTCFVFISSVPSCKPFIPIVYRRRWLTCHYC